MTTPTTNGNTPAPGDEVSKPPEGVVLPPKDIRGQFLVPFEKASAMDAGFTDVLHSNRREDGWLCGSEWSCIRGYVSFAVTPCSAMSG